MVAVLKLFLECVCVFFFVDIVYSLVATVYTPLWLTLVAACVLLLASTFYGVFYAGVRYRNTAEPYVHGMRHRRVLFFSSARSESQERE